MESYLEIKVDVEEELVDICIALLSDLPFDVFGYTDTGFSTSLVAKDHSLEGIKAEMEEALEAFDCTISVEEKDGVNWNALWESNFQPILIDGFCGLRADFHPSFEEKLDYELIITPKMAFGSGHHETTRMMIRQMRDIDFKGKSVFDFGCGTGVLAILAAQMGASPVEGVDIELASYENSIENCKANAVPEVLIQQGGISKASLAPYDVILANINRNIVIDSLLKMRQILKKGGLMVCSGFLENDVPLVLKKAAEYGFQPEHLIGESDWRCIRFKLG